MRPGHWRCQIDSIAQLVRRRKMRPVVERDFDRLTSSWDHGEFIRQTREMWDPFAGARPAKFLNLDTWLTESIFRYHESPLAKMPAARRVLDLGCGAGYFLAACRLHGHEVTGLDLDDEPLYNTMIQFLRLPRVVHRITPQNPLPDFPNRFHLITAYMTCFDRHDDRTPWTPAEWTSFLQAVRTRLEPGGVFLMLPNVNPVTGELYSAAVARAFESVPGFRRVAFQGRRILFTAE